MTQTRREGRERTGPRWYVRLLSWNLHALPLSAGRSPRLRRVAAVVMARLPDAVLFQEVWARGDRRDLESRLGDRYQRVEAPARGGLWRPSGLLIFVRDDWTIEQTAFHGFSMSAPGWRVWEADELSGKGVLSVRVGRGGRHVTLVTTHLQAEYGDHRYGDVRAAQLGELGDVIERLPWAPPIILAGDLNTRPDEDAVLQGFLQDWLDLGRGVREQCRCGTQMNADGRPGAWIDYVLARPPAGGYAATVDFELFRNRSLDDPYSDHHGLFATIEMQEGRSAPLLGALLASPLRVTRRRSLLASVVGTLDLVSRRLLT